MGEGGSDAAAVEVDDASALAAREDDAPVEGIVALPVEQAETLQEIARMTLSGEMPAQVPTGGVADPQLLEQGGIVQSALLQIVPRLGVTIELLLMKSGGLLEHDGSVGWRSTLLLEVSDALTEGQMARQLDKAQEIAALAATVAVEEIFVSVDIERRAGFGVQRTKADELRAVTGRPGDPVLLPQIIKQRKALFEFFEVLAHGAVLPLEANVEEGRQHSQARMVGGEIFSETQGPENMQNRSQPRQRLSLVIGRINRCQPGSDAGERLTEKGKSRLGTVQGARPAAERGGIGHAVRVFERRRCFFPGAVLQKAPPQRLTASQQAVMSVRERKQGQESEGLSAPGAAAAADANPIVMLVMRLLAAASMADDGIAFTSGASPHDDFGAARRPIRFELVRRDGKWDKQNRSSLELCPTGVDLRRSEPGAELLPLKQKIQLEENTASWLWLFRGVIHRIGR